MRHRISRRSDCFFLRVGRIDDGVANRDRNRIDVDFVFMNLNGPNDRVLNSHVRANVVELETRFGRPVRFAITIDTPTGDEGAVPNYDARSADRTGRTIILTRWSGDSQWTSSY